MVDILGCEVGGMPFNYLGIKVGPNKKRASDWNLLVEKFKRKLNLWGDKKLSFGGRLTLLNAVLTAIPTYHFSAHILPNNTLKALSSLQRKFLWGGDEHSQKIAWISWDTICKSKCAGWLGVKDLKAFNKALLGKWLWQFLLNKDCLWVNVIKSIYGELKKGENGIISLTRPAGMSKWWRDVIANGSGGDGGWFWQNLERKVGNGRYTNIWDDCWAGDSSLKRLFTRLFHLSLKQDASIKDMGEWEEGKWMWKWEWRRDLLERKWDMLNSFSSLLNRFTLTEEEEDTWRWRGSWDGIYHTKEAYDFIKSIDMSEDDTQLVEEWKEFNLVRKSWTRLR